MPWGDVVSDSKNYTNIDKGLNCWNNWDSCKPSKESDEENSFILSIPLNDENQN